MDVDLESLTVAEWDEVRRVTGCAPADLLDRMDGDAVAALTWVVLRRSDPSVTFESVRDAGVSTVQGDGVRRSDVDVMARVCVALRIGPAEFRGMTPVEVAAVVHVLDEQLSEAFDGG